MVKPKLPTSYEELTHVILNYYVGPLQAVSAVSCHCRNQYFPVCVKNLGKTKWHLHNCLISVIAQIEPKENLLCKTLSS